MVPSGCPSRGTLGRRFLLLLIIILMMMIDILIDIVVRKHVRSGPVRGILCREAPLALGTGPDLIHDLTLERFELVNLHGLQCPALLVARHDAVFPVWPGLGQGGGRGVEGRGRLASGGQRANNVDRGEEWVLRGLGCGRGDLVGLARELNGVARGGVGLVGSGGRGRGRVRAGGLG